ncbi:hypothetical protein [Pararobbsia silviterrae]|uniref:Uncharacterized protein n=1 Tax=Pararobbsia silviterrae TaxID=1792498 RepID=A0A494Y5S6_9BURK|nr:hypothetical protein [Pararobbsia silviterrae]RKP57633.1 hypothetical protein D7S86_06720 [Pararobbsia silviterrae]
MAVVVHRGLLVSLCASVALWGAIDWETGGSPMAATLLLISAGIGLDRIERVCRGRLGQLPADAFADRRADTGATTFASPSARPSTRSLANHFALTPGIEADDARVRTAPGASAAEPASGKVEGKGGGKGEDGATLTLSTIPAQAVTLSDGLEPLSVVHLVDGLQHGDASALGSEAHADDVHWGTSVYDVDAKADASRTVRLSRT